MEYRRGSRRLTPSPVSRCTAILFLPPSFFTARWASGARLTGWSAPGITVVKTSRSLQCAFVSRRCSLHCRRSQRSIVCVFLFPERGASCTRTFHFWRTGNLVSGEQRKQPSRNNPGFEKRVSRCSTSIIRAINSDTTFQFATVVTSVL